MERTRSDGRGLAVAHAHALALALAALLASACSGGGGGGGGGGGTGGGGGGKPVKVDLAGAVQKGPFVLGSKVNVSPLGADFQPTGQNFPTSTISDLGEFAVTFEASGTVRLEGDGFYYNELVGKLSDAALTLRALYDIKQAGTQAAYINLFTHLGFERALKLARDGAATDAAITQAETELRAALGVGPMDLALGKRGIDLNVTGGDDVGNAYLLAVSAVVMQAARTRAMGGSLDAALQELLNGMSIDMQADGMLSAATAKALADAEKAVDPEEVMDFCARGWRCWVRRNRCRT